MTIDERAVHSAGDGFGVFGDWLWMRGIGGIEKGNAVLSIGRAFAVRPGTPADRVAILREALAKTIADPQFQAEAKKAQIDMEYISAQDVIKGFDEMMSQSPQVIDAMNKYLQPEQ